MPPSDNSFAKFTLAPCVQSLILLLEDLLLKRPYEQFGKNSQSGERYNIVHPSDFGSARRKPVTPEFQNYSEHFWNAMNVLLFGDEYETIAKHLLSFKVNTIKVSECAPYYGTNAYHMHLDNRVGLFEEKNETQRRKIRVVFSVVHGYNESYHPKYRSTVFLKEQSPAPFKSQHEFHKYMQSRYTDTGTESGNSRPIYAIPPKDLTWSMPGDVTVHHSHCESGSQEIHAEANPVPDGRVLIAIDFQDIIHGRENKKQIPATRIPEKLIIQQMAVLADPTTKQFRDRMALFCLKSGLATLRR